jgi:hypothetical protein
VALALVPRALQSSPIYELDCWPVTATEAREMMRTWVLAAMGLALGLTGCAHVTRDTALLAVGQELRLVLTGDFDLAALVLDLQEQPGVLDG